MQIGQFFERQPRKVFSDARGILTPFEFKDLPFNPVRSFVVSDVPNGIERGNHSHHKTLQYLVCLQGLIIVRLDNGYNKQELCLRFMQSVLIDRLVWDSQIFYDNAILLVYCSTEYDQKDYITDYNEFLKIVKQSKK